MIKSAHFAPTELWLVPYYCGYKHSAPTELKRFVWGPGHCEPQRLHRETRIGKLFPKTRAWLSLEMSLEKKHE